MLRITLTVIIICIVVLFIAGVLNRINHYKKVIKEYPLYYWLDKWEIPMTIMELKTAFAYDSIKIYRYWGFYDKSEISKFKKAVKKYIKKKESDKHAKMRDTYYIEQLEATETEQNGELSCIDNGGALSIKETK